MTELKAFVAHSFTPGDKDHFSPTDQVVVGEFLKILDEIAKLNPNFSWEHAELAQPREVSDKVLSLWSDKTVFIAICTKKEQVIIVSVLGDCAGLVHRQKMSFGRRPIGSSRKSALQ